MGRKLDTLQKERWQPTQCHAGLDCAQAMILLLGAVATTQRFTFSLQPFSAYFEVCAIPYPSIIDLYFLVQRLLTWSLWNSRGFHEPSEIIYKILCMSMCTFLVKGT